jgi:hypothetical protein
MNRTVTHRSRQGNTKIRAAQAPLPGEHQRLWAKEDLLDKLLALCHQSLTVATWYGPFSRPVRAHLAIINAVWL